MTVANLEKLWRLIKNIKDNLPLSTPPSSKVKGIQLNATFQKVVNVSTGLKGIKTLNFELWWQIRIAERG